MNNQTSNNMAEYLAETYRDLQTMLERTSTALDMVKLHRHEETPAVHDAHFDLLIEVRYRATQLEKDISRHLNKAKEQ